MRLVPARDAFFEIKNTLFSVETLKSTSCLEGCSIPNVLNLEKLGVKIVNCSLLLGFIALFLLYCVHALFYQSKSCMPTL